MFRFNELSALCTKFGQRIWKDCKAIHCNRWGHSGVVPLALIVMFSALSCTVGGETAPVFNRKPEPYSKVRIDLNNSSPSELEALPGIGEKTALRIIGFRDRHGPFRRIENLMLIDGISEKKFLALAPHVEVR